MSEISSLRDNPNYRPEAISHQDFRSTFTDANLLIPGTSIPISGHTNPMGVEVQMETYNWNYRVSDFFVIVNMTLKNVGAETYDDLHVALWANTVVRNVNATPAGAGGSVFYSQGGNGFLDSLHMAYCYDATGDVGMTDSYIGQKFLGAEDKTGFKHPDISTGFKDHYNAWIFNNSGQALFFFPTSDPQRYVKMTQGLNQNPCWDDPTGVDCQNGVGMDIQALLNASGNRSDLVSVGPFSAFAPGDEITLAYAFVLGKKVDDGNPNAANTAAKRHDLLAMRNGLRSLTTARTSTLTACSMRARTATATAKSPASSCPVPPMPHACGPSPAITASTSFGRAMPKKASIPSPRKKTLRATVST